MPSSTPLQTPLEWVGSARNDLLTFPDTARRNAGNAFQAVYTVRFEKTVYVLHCFQKKSPSGIRTAKTDVDLIHERLLRARQHSEVRYGSQD